MSNYFQRFNSSGDRNLGKFARGPDASSTLGRELTYRFHLHYHPFTKELDDRLIQGSIPGLLAADTEYATQAILQRDVTATFQEHAGSDSETVNLKQNEIILLPDGTRLKLASGEWATFAGPVVVLDGDAGDRVQLPPGVTVTLPSLTLVERSEVGETGERKRVRLTAAVGITVPSGNPRPRFFEDFFGSYLPAGAPPGTDVAKPGAYVDPRHPVRDLDFTPEGAYSVYNWELFCHAQWLMAVHHSTNKNFEAAEACFRSLFDPTDTSAGPTPERFWKVKPFQTTEVRCLEEILTNLATNADPQLKERTIHSIGNWQETPFRPFAVARVRQSAFMFGVLMAYFDHKIAWGDCLFRTDNPENIERARLEYICVANLLGPRPQAVPRKGTIAPRTYAALKGHLEKFGTVLEAVESDLPFDLSPMPQEASGGAQLRSLGHIGYGLYFCVPRNEKLLAYWDTVADRLFKIRNSLNLQGIFRRLPLFPPRIDPALLARAAASGLDISAIASGLNQPLPLVRFQLLVQKALEICQEVKALGNSLLSAIEKQDNEALAVLRAKHEGIALKVAESVRYSQWQEAIKNREALEQSYENARQRYFYWQRSLGAKESDLAAKVPALSAITAEQLERLQFTQADPPPLALDPFVPDIATGGGEGAGDITGGRIMSSNEKQELNLLEKAEELQIEASVTDALASVSNAIPTFGLNLEPLGCGPTISFGGSNLGAVFAALGAEKKGVAGAITYDANRASRLAVFARRELDWHYQGNLAAGDIPLICKQHRAAQIREHLSWKEFDNHQKLIARTKEIEDFLTLATYTDADGQEQRGKTTNQDFQLRMRREVQNLYNQCYDFAFEVAKKAERALQHELGDFSQTFIKYDYQSGPEGLLAGEKLYLDLKRMEMAYLDLNRREYELTKHISVLQVAPLALIQLRTTGRCTVSLPEDLFDMDGPGHYFRRIKTVAISIPCVAGPYASVNCTATLVKSSVRISGVVSSDGYARTGADDIRFSDYFGSMQSIVTSSAQNDSGMFETNLRDERYLPFEGSGAVSEWQLELPATVRQWDHNTLRDVIMHFKFTAREAGGLLRAGAVKNLEEKIAAAEAAGSVRLFSLQHEFPSEWAKFKQVKLDGTTKTAPLAFDLRPEHFPIWSRGRLTAFRRIELIAQNVKRKITITDDAANSDTLEKAPNKFAKGRIKTPPAIDHEAPLLAKFRWNLDENQMDDLWLAISWGAEE